MNSPTPPSGSPTLPVQGERFQCEQCQMEIEVIRDCQCVAGQPQFICCGRPLTSLGQSYWAETKEVFIQQTQKGLDKAMEAITRLRERANEAADATKAEMDREAESLAKKYEGVRQSLGEVKSASNDAWRDLAKGCSESWLRFRAACDRAVSRYQ